MRWPRIRFSVRWWLVAVAVAGLFLGLERNLLDYSARAVRYGINRDRVLDTICVWIYMNAILYQPLVMFFVAVRPVLRRLSGQQPR